MIEQRGNTALLWLGSDLRLADNPALQRAIASQCALVPVFIWAPEEEAPWSPGAASRWWLHQSLTALEVSLKKLGSQNVTSLLVEGGGEVNASFLLGGFAQRVAFFYAPKILGGRDARKGVAGDGAKRLSEVVQLDDIQWRTLGEDLLLTAKVVAG